MVAKLKGAINISSIPYQETSVAFTLPNALSKGAI
jgi:hypothetical protein